MTDLTKLKELAERATPGRNFDRLPSAGGGLKYTCTGDDDSLVLRVDHKNGEFGFIGPKGDEDEAFFLACTPQAILGLLERLEKAEQHWANENSNNMALIAEVERMRKDAERYRMLRQKDRGGVVVRDRTSHLFGDSLDAAIDAALKGGGR